MINETSAVRRELTVQGGRTLVYLSGVGLESGSNQEKYSSGMFKPVEVVMGVNAMEETIQC